MTPESLMSAKIKATSWPRKSMFASVGRQGDTNTRSVWGPLPATPRYRASRVQWRATPPARWGGASHRRVRWVSWGLRASFSRLFRALIPSTARLRRAGGIQHLPV
jgi:hypothetical protein